jgi:hypothetical protein
MRRAALLPALVLAISAVALTPPAAEAVGPGGWDHVGAGPGATSPLNGDVLAMTTDYAGFLIAGGKFTDAGGDPNADRIAYWNGYTWNAIGFSSAFNGDVMAVATLNGYVYAGAPSPMRAATQPPIIWPYGPAPVGSRFAPATWAETSPRSGWPVESSTSAGSSRTRTAYPQRTISSPAPL